MFLFNRKHYYINQEKVDFKICIYLDIDCDEWSKFKYDLNLGNTMKEVSWFQYYLYKYLGKRL